LRFSELYPVDQTDEDDWFDTFLPADSNLCVDPFLIYEDSGPQWTTAHDRVLEFFALMFELIRHGGDNKKSVSWRQAERLLLFPEPAEFCLGVAEGSSQGAGAGPGLQKDMLDGITAAVRAGLTNVPHMEMLALFQGGMGLDRMSDAVCNILKSYFISYTQDVCRRHAIPTQTFLVKNASWSREFARWQDRRIELPLNPYPHRPIGVLLTPERFLKDIPVVTADDFWSYAWANHADDLRRDMNFDLARNTPRYVKARLARQHISVTEAYFHELEQNKHEPYPVQSDPKMLVNWYESGAGILDKQEINLVPSSPMEFAFFIQQIIYAFRQSIEQQDAWQLLWYNSVPRKERVVQALFRSVVIHYCRSHGIDISGESNAGRGPVDFKFSQGWNARAIIEIKLMRNSAFWDGILQQTPQYARSEEVKSAFLVAVAYTDEDMDPSRLDKIDQAARMASRENNIDVRAIVIDARQKLSASKLKATIEEREELHRDADDSDNVNGSLPGISDDDNGAGST
jgi:hypothetical protein